LANDVEEAKKLVLVGIGDRMFYEEVIKFFKKNPAPIVYDNPEAWYRHGPAAFLP
jgi:hypothetical protein